MMMTVWPRVGILQVRMMESTRPVIVRLDPKEMAVPCQMQVGVMVIMVEEVRVD
jgi:hypothetical protein